MNFNKLILVIILYLFCTLSFGQNKYYVAENRFPYKSFDSISVYKRDDIFIKGKSQNELAKAYKPDKLVDNNKISSYYKYCLTLNNEETNQVIKIINKKSYSIERGCATVFSDFGFIFCGGDEIVGFFEISMDCNEVFFFPENRNWKGSFNKKQVKILLNFLSKLNLMKKYKI